MMDFPDNITKEERLMALSDELALELLPAILFVGSLMVMGAFGNSLVLFIFATRLKSGTTQNFLIMCLAAIDLFTCLLAIPLEIVDMRQYYTFNSDLACKILRFMLALGSLSSVFTLIVIAGDRYIKICRPLGRQMTLRDSKVGAAIAVLLGLLLSWPATILKGAKQIETSIPGLYGKDCSTSDAVAGTPYPLVYNAILFFLFVVITVLFAVVYFKIYRKVKRCRNTRNNVQASSPAKSYKTSITPVCLAGENHPHLERTNETKQSVFSIETGSDAGQEKAGVVDMQGTKTKDSNNVQAYSPSKSSKNSMTPDDLIRENGATLEPSHRNGRASETNVSVFTIEKGGNAGQDVAEVEKQGIKRKDSNNVNTCSPSKDPKNVTELLDPQSASLKLTEKLNNLHPNKEKLENTNSGKEVQKMKMNPTLENGSGLLDPESAREEMSENKNNFDLSIKNQQQPDKSQTKDLVVTNGTKVQNPESARVDLKERQNNGDNIENQEKPGNKDPDKETKKKSTEMSPETRTTLIAFLVTTFFILSGLPYLALTFVHIMHSEVINSLRGPPLVAMNLFVRFYFVNNAVNPFIYGYLNTQFRAGIKTACRKYFC